LPLYLILVESQSEGEEIADQLQDMTISTTKEIPKKDNTDSYDVTEFPCENTLSTRPFEISATQLSVVYRVKTRDFPMKILGGLSFGQIRFSKVSMTDTMILLLSQQGSLFYLKDKRAFSSEPTPISHASKFKEISASEHCAAISEEGDLYYWGKLSSFKSLEAPNLVKCSDNVRFKKGDFNSSFFYVLISLSSVVKPSFYVTFERGR